VTRCNRSYAQRVVRSTWYAGALALSACTGNLEIPQDPFGGSAQGANPQADDGRDLPSASSGPGAPVGPGAPAGQVGTGAPATPSALCVTPSVSPSPMRRLTHREYENSVRELLGSSTDNTLTDDTQHDLFDTMAHQHVSVLLADQYLEAATELAEGVPDIRKLVGCDPAAAGNTCVRGFIERFTRRAYRRPRTDDELTRLSSLYESTKSASDPATGVRAVVAAVLASPHFLFRPEFGVGSSDVPNALKPSPFELSGRLSFLLWSSLPDDALLDAAAKGELATKAQLAAQAKRMLDDPRARAGVLGFYEQWLGLPLLSTTTKDKAIYPSFDDSLRSAMREETRRFVEHVLWQDDAKLETLLTAPYGFVNKPLAALYGVSGPSDAVTFSKVMQDPARRSGVLTQASIMAAFASSDTSSPVKRGKWVRTRMLCQDLPEPPANIPPLPPPAQGISTRERFAMHTASAACSGCHKLIDGLGFGFERYDGIGAYRTMDLGVQVDQRGQVTSTTDIDGAYEGGPALAALLAQSEQVRDCAPTQWFRYSFGRRESDEDVCSLGALQEAFRASDGDLKQLLIELTQSDAFINYRKPG
jgi:hypothetical protein